MFKKFFAKREKEIIPDSPIGFGYKNKWLAVSSNNNEEVAKFLELKEIKKSNWFDGLEFGYRKGVFLTPEINGWVLVLGIDISDLEIESTQKLLKSVSEEFGECQIFQTHRVVDYHFWGLARFGKIERLYSIGESGNSIIEGEPTEAELDYNLVNTFSEESKKDDYWEREDIDIPNEETVMEIAEAWSINPTRIDEFQNVEGIGLIGK
jgi:hypothetical protein